jgi:ankyrin repeat protein
MSKQKKSRYQQDLYYLQRQYDEQSGGDHTFEIVLNAAASDADFLGFLVNRGTKIDPLNEKSRSPLYWMIGEGNLSAVKRLLNQGADPNLCLLGEPSPLMYAAYLGNLALVNLLLERSAQVSYQDKDGETALTIAQTQGHQQIIDRLCE